MADESRHRRRSGAHTPAHASHWREDGFSLRIAGAIVCLSMVLATGLGLSARASRNAALQAEASASADAMAYDGAAATDAANPTDPVASNPTDSATDPALTARTTAALAELRADLNSMISGYDGTWSVYASTLADGNSISINSSSTYSASVIKLFVMAAVEQAIESGALADTPEVANHLEQMITVSSNDDTNSLIEILGGGSAEAGLAAVNAFAASQGFTDTTMSELIGLPTGDPNRKQTSVNDVGRLLSMVYHGTLVNADASARMMALLQAQQLTGKIPAGVPAGTVTANKTGEITGVENDAAIIWTGGATDYVLVIFSSGVPDSATARANITAMSTVAWNALSAL
ncbi:serine hydrolase [Pseudoscardovia radai]|nr:serine hydrolase [Pseudoscardovia radai]